MELYPLCFSFLFFLCCLVFHLLLILPGESMSLSLPSPPLAVPCWAVAICSVSGVWDEILINPFSLHLKETLVWQNSISECIPTKADSRQVLIFSSDSKLRKAGYQAACSLAQWRSDSSGKIVLGILCTCLWLMRSQLPAFRKMLPIRR